MTSERLMRQRKFHDERSSQNLIERVHRLCVVPFFLVYCKMLFSCEKSLIWLLIFSVQGISMVSATALSSWCASQGTNAYYLNQICYTLTTASKSYVANADVCTAMPNGQLAMLTATDIIQNVSKNLLQKSSASMFFVAFVQLVAQNQGRNDNWFWVDANNNTFGRSPDIQWASGEPDDRPKDSDGLDDGHENCAVIDHTGVLRDTSCTATSMPAVCQYRESLLNYQSVTIGSKVASNSTALIAGKSEIPIDTPEICGIMCKMYVSCRGFALNKSLLTCTLLFKYNLAASDLVVDSDYEIYGLY